MHGNAKEVSEYLRTLLCLGETEENLQLKQKAKETEDLLVRPPPAIVKLFPWNSIE
jgi:hypothetical protein